MTLPLLRAKFISGCSAGYYREGLVMATMFGRFEIQSELSKSNTALIYKALDTETNQVVALKTQSLAPLGDRAEAFVDALIAEGEATRDLVSQNIVPLYGAGEIDGQFCAAMEYIQGNSIATMLSRKEGFSIWDLLDISRQLCAGLEHAAAKNVAHNSLEPAKIMVQWDGMVKILGYGISSMSLIEAESGNGLGPLMPYCSPEQIRGEAIDLRSNLFTVGAILYEMVVGRKAFDAADPATLVNRIEHEMPANPSSVNPKIQPAVSALIMKALAKDPAERHQSARELVDDLEKCKDSGKKIAETKKPVAAAKIAVDPAARAAAASKFVTSASNMPKPPARPLAPKPAAAVPRTTASSFSSSEGAPTQTHAAAAAAGAGVGGSGTRGSEATANAYSSPTIDHSAADSAATSESGTDSGARLISDFEMGAPESQPSPVMSAATVEEEEIDQPQVAGDPVMTEQAPSSSGVSFSDLDELPPLKEPVYVPPPPEPAVEQTRTVAQIYPRKEEKPRIQPREVAEKAMKEISTIPPRLMLFSILGAVVVILVIALGVYFHVRSEDDGSTAAPRPVKAAKSEAVAPVAKPQPAPEPAPAAEPPAEAEPNLTVRQVEKRAARRPAPVHVPPPVVPGQALIDSSPQGAQFQIDGKSDPSWVTPFSVMNLAPGKHMVSVAKAGYQPDIRSIEVTAGAKSSLVLHLAPINALMVVNSTPAGAEILLDGKPTGRITPAQFAVEKGNHTILVRKAGFLDETVTAELAPAQNFQFSPALRALGNAAEIKTVGKLNKLFGRGGDNTAGMGTISIHTQPKGAQIAINQRVLDKLSPVDLMVGPGNYIVDITLTGFKPVHKVINVDKAGKAAVDEVLERE